MKNNSPDWLPTRRSLLKDWDDQESWQVFFDDYWKLIYSLAIKAGLNDAEAQDVVQETVLSVCRQMPDFKYDPGIGSFKSWLSLICRRRIASARVHRRACHPRSLHPWLRPPSREPGPLSFALGL